MAAIWSCHGGFGEIYLGKKFSKFFFDHNVLNRNFGGKYFFWGKKFLDLKSIPFTGEVDSSKPGLVHSRDDDKMKRFIHT